MLEGRLHCAGFLVGLNEEHRLPTLGVERLRPFVSPNPNPNPPGYITYNPETSLEVNWEDEDKDSVRNYDQASTVRSTIPMFLLRRYFKTKEPVLWLLYHYVFCDFRYTLAAVREGKLDMKTCFKDLYYDRHKDRVYGLSEAEVSHALHEADVDKNMNVLRALLYRLCLAHRALHLARSKGEKRIEYQLQLFIDTHIALSNYISYFKAYTDDKLLNDDTNFMNIAKCALEQFYPKPSDVSHCGDLPNVAPVLQASNIWYAIRPQFHCVLSALIHIIGCKTQTHKCQVRNFTLIIRKYIVDFPVLLILFRRFMEVSFLGNYPHCNYRPRYERRMEIRWAFQQTAVLTDDKLLEWMDHNDVFTYFMTKEFYLTLIRYHYAFDIMLEETSQWRAVKTATISAMDIARSKFCRAEVRNASMYADIERELNTIHEHDTLPHITKLRKASFIDIALGNMNKYNETHVVDKTMACSQLSELKLPANIIRTIEIVCTHLVEVGDERVHTRFLKCFGVTEQGYEQFRDLYFSYEKKDIPDNAIRKRIIEIYENNSVDHMDFHLIRVYLKMLKQKFSFRSFYLSGDILERQAMALRERHSLAPWEPLRDDDDLFSYCPNCGQWAHSVMDTDLEQKKFADPANRLGAQIAVYAHGFEAPLYDFTDHKLYCGRQSTSTGAKKMAESEEYRQDQRPVQDPRVAKILRKMRENSSCTNTVLVPVHMLGKIQELPGGKQWILCEACAQLTQFDGTKFNHCGFTCSVHRREQKEVTATAVKKLAALQASRLTLGVLPLELPSGETANLQHLNEIRTKLGIISTNDKKCCTYCGGTTEKRGLLSSLKMIDDSIEGDLKFINVSLCDVDSNYGSRALTADLYPRKSVVWECITRARKDELINHGVAQPARQILELYCSLHKHSLRQTQCAIRSENL